MLARTKIASVILEQSHERRVNLPKLRISIVQYLNTAPLVWGFTHGPLRGKYDLSFTVPSLCAEALRTGAVDIAIIPAIEYQRILGLVILPDLAIASKNRVRSLLLVSKIPIERARSIALDSSSRSTQALVRILCANHWKNAPEFRQAAPDLAAMLKTADAALLIGDPALRLSIAIEGAAAEGSNGEQICDGKPVGIDAAAKVHIYDMAAEWRRFSGQPAVLAVWAARPQVATHELADQFRASLEYGQAHLDEISAQASRELQLPAPALKQYLCDNIDFSLDAENLRGLSYYFELCASLGIIPAVTSISLTPAAAPIPARQSA
jgi:chorismate dehydratase